MTKRKLYWVKFVNQDNGLTIDSYFIANNLAHLEYRVADILKVRVISNIIDLTKEPTPEEQSND